MRSCRLGLLLALGVAAASAAMCAGAAVFNVDTTVDDPGLISCDDATPNDCSLRGAIIKANGLTEPVTINVPAGTYILSQATPCSFRGNDIGPLFSAIGLCPTENLTILGAGADATIFDANQPPGNNGTFATVLFVATTANVTMRGVTIRHGNYSTSSLIGAGGGINNAGTLTLVDSSVIDNWTLGSGGGIFNQGDLTVLRGVISRNQSAGDGGAIFNSNLFGTCLAVSPCHEGQSILTVADSTISQNTSIVANGGGIFNSVGMIDISGSTISGNDAIGGGGGIYNAAWNVNLTNVTLSGNRARIGGGIFAGGAASSVHLNNVTVADNTAQGVNDPSFGSGGGVLNGAFGTLTLANTIVAGNFAAGSCTVNGCFPAGNDCVTDAPHGGPLTSQGHNLIQDTQACDIVGDTIGNITGQDPKLGVLADNGGHGFTHALAPDSPAVDAGSPATPGSGAAACGITDERAVLRPVGPHCDIGAFERNGIFLVSSIYPASGGNAGQVSVRISGGGFADSASVKLSRAGSPDIPAIRTHVDIGGAPMAATFDLTGASPGAWDVVVTNPDATSRTLAAGFTVRPGVGADIWADVVGTLLNHNVSTVTIYYGNRGDADAVGVPFTLSLPGDYQPGRFFDITPPPAQAGEVRPDWNFVPAVVALPGQTRFLQLPLFLPLVPAGYSGILRISLRIPPSREEAILVAAPGNSEFTDSGTTFVTNAVTGAQGYLQQVFGISVPAAVVPQLQQYATTQFQLLIENGRNVFATSIGTRPLIYSLAQLQLDLALFAASHTAAAADSAAPASRQ